MDAANNYTTLFLPALSELYISRYTLNCWSIDFLLCLAKIVLEMKRFISQYELVIFVFVNERLESKSLNYNFETFYGLTFSPCICCRGFSVKYSLLDQEWFAGLKGLDIKNCMD